MFSGYLPCDLTKDQHKNILVHISTFYEPSDFAMKRTTYTLDPVSHFTFEKYRKSDAHLTIGCIIMHANKLTIKEQKP